MIEKIAVLFRNKPDSKLNPIKGAYTALAIFLPLIILAWLGYSDFGVQVMLGALLTSFGDVGTSRRTQAWSLGMIAVGGALMTALGRVVGQPWWLALSVLFFAVFITGLFAVYGQVIAAVGLLLIVPLVVSLGAHGGAATALPAAGGYLLGGAILMLFALIAASLQSNHNRAGSPISPAKRSRPTLNTFVAQFTFISPLLRYNLLRALGTASAVEISWGLGGSYPYWTALTVLICARQDKETSLTMALQYGIATLLSALLAEVLIVSLQRLLVIGLVLVGISFFAFTVKDRNYTIYVFFFTTLILLLLNLGPSGHSFALWRIVATLIGIGIVLIIILLNQALTFVIENGRRHSFS